jgi:dihydroorotate dehydrogenase (NAD+) catalytic subunit
VSDVDLEVRVGTLTLRNPVLTASGTFGYGLEYDDFFDVSTLGGICTKGLSLEPRAGNPPDRICETAAGMLNAIGLANVGVEAFCRDKLPTLRRRGVTVVANVFATTVEDAASTARRASPPSSSTSPAPTSTRAASSSAATPPPRRASPPRCAR